MRVIGIGAGGHAKVVLECVRAMRDDIEVVGLLDADKEHHGQSVLGATVLGGDELLEKLHAQGVRHAFIGVGGVRDNAPRRRVFDNLLRHHFEVLTVISDTAIVSPSAAVGVGSVGWMLTLGAIMAIEKNVSWGRRLSIPLGVVLCVWGTGVAVGGDP